MNVPKLLRLGLLMLMLAGTAQPQRVAALVEPFEPTLVITDEEFNDSYAMSCQAVQDFLNERPGILKSYVIGDKTAAQMICEQSNRFGVNPRLLLTLVQKEQGLLTAEAPSARALDYAAGCGPGWESTRGFANQVECAARTLRNRFNTVPLGDAVDGAIPTNRATFALYRYNNNQKGVQDFYRIWARYFPQSHAGEFPTEIVVDSRNVEATPPVKNTCRSGWAIGTKGLGGHHLVTPNAAGKADSTNTVIWRPNIPREGAYQVLVFVPNRAAVPWLCGGGNPTLDTTRARYTVKHRDGETTYEVNQAPLMDAWVNIGTYFFAQGTDGYVALSDITGEPAMSRYVSIDEAKWLWVTP